MQATDAFDTLRRMGFILRPRGDRLAVEPRDRITPEARALIKAHRDALLHLARTVSDPVPPESLAATQNDPANLIDVCLERICLTDSIPLLRHDFLERAAILEFCEELPRAEADALALAEFGYS